MAARETITILKTFQKAPRSSKWKQKYLRDFEKKMIYRTTKTENPEVTPRLVEKTFRKLTSKNRG